MQREGEQERASGDIPPYVDAFVVHVWWCLPLLRNLSVQKVIECALEKPLACYQYRTLGTGLEQFRVWH